MFVPRRIRKRIRTCDLTSLSAQLRKPAIVIVLVLTGFLAGVPPAMMAAIGAALMLITRTRDPRLVYDEVDWGLLVFFVGLFLIVGGAENAGMTRLPLRNRGTVQSPERRYLYGGDRGLVESGQQCTRGDAAQNA